MMLMRGSWLADVGWWYCCLRVWCGMVIQCKWTLLAEGTCSGQEVQCDDTIIVEWAHLGCTCRGTGDEMTRSQTDWKKINKAVRRIWPHSIVSTKCPFASHRIYSEACEYTSKAHNGGHPSTHTAQSNCSAYSEACECGLHELGPQWWESKQSTCTTCNQVEEVVQSTEQESLTPTSLPKPDSKLVEDSHSTKIDSHVVPSTARQQFA